MHKLAGRGLVWTCLLAACAHPTAPVSSTDAGENSDAAVVDAGLPPAGSDAGSLLPDDASTPPPESDAGPLLPEDDGGFVDFNDGGMVDPNDPDDGAAGKEGGTLDGGEDVNPDAGEPPPSASGGTSGMPGATQLSCQPAEANTTQGGGRCADLNEAWTARGINVGYYPFLVTAPITQYSGDYSGPPGTPFVQGRTAKGVILQIVQPGAYVGLSSSGPWYDPPTGCFPGTQTCGADYRAACRSSSPPLRSGRAGFYWGYAYSGASHLQGWFELDPSKLEWAGNDPNHPCALGPAGADYEVHAACGAALTCRGSNPSCGHVNPCSEGADDCGRTACGARSGGPLTPAAHRLTVQSPASAVACTQRHPPHPSVRCLPNGTTTDFFFVYPFGAYLYWAQNSTTKAWLHNGDQVQAYFHNRDSEGVLWDFVEVLDSGAPVLTPPSDGAGAGGGCSASNPSACAPCLNGGTCGWIQDVFLR